MGDLAARWKELMEAPNFSQQVGNALMERAITTGIEGAPRGLVVDGDPDIVYGGHVDSTVISAIARSFSRALEMYPTPESFFEAGVSPIEELCGANILGEIYKTDEFHETLQAFNLTDTPVSVEGTVDVLIHIFSSEDYFHITDQSVETLIDAYPDIVIFR